MAGSYYSADAAHAVPGRLVMVCIVDAGVNHRIGVHHGMVKIPAIGDQVFVREGGEEIGAVRQIRGDKVRVYVENAGDFDVPAAAIRAVHDGKVILDPEHLSDSMRDAISHAHDAERPDL